MNKLYYLLLTICTLLSTTACSLKTAPFYSEIYSLDNSLNTFDCKCKYNETTNHSPTGSFPPYNKADLKSMAIEANIYAIMSFNAYSDTPQINVSGWKRIKRFKSLKGIGADVYLSAANEIIIAFRGTDGFFAFDDHFFANFVLGKFGWGQFAQADQIYSEIKRDYNPSKITTTGHSLGGGLAIRISLLNSGVDAYVFDTSSRVSTSIENIYNNKIVSIRESGEFLAPLRFLSMFDEIHSIHRRYNYLGGNPFKEHSMERFAQCMYITATLSDIEYEKRCKK